MTNKWTKTPEGRAWKREYCRKMYADESDARRTRAMLRRRNKRAHLLIDAAKRRAVKRGIVFDLDGFKEQLQARVDAGFCELSGVPFNVDGGRTFDSPSLDRIDPSKGYTYENIRVVCDLMNRALNDYGEGAVEFVMTAYLARKKVVAPQAAEFILAYAEARGLILPQLANAA